MLPYTTNRYKNKTSPDLSIMKRLGGTNAAKVQLLFETAKYICVKIIFSANIRKFFMPLGAIKVNIAVIFVILIIVKFSIFAPKLLT